MKGVGHVIADAAYDADPLRSFIADDLGATAHIKANPSRTAKPAIDWHLYKEHHQVECFFNRLKRFCRIALRCEKTISAFMGFVPSCMRHDLVKMYADNAWRLARGSASPRRTAAARSATIGRHQASLARYQRIVASSPVSKLSRGAQPSSSRIRGASIATRSTSVNGSSFMPANLGDADRRV